MSYHGILQNLDSDMRVSFNTMTSQGTPTPELLVEQVVSIRDEMDTLRVDLQDPVNGAKYSVESRDEGEDIFVSEITSHGPDWYSEVETIEIIAE